MPSYFRQGRVPPKRHIQFRRPDGGLYAEELFSTKGFENVYSLPLPFAAADGDAGRARVGTSRGAPAPNEPLRNRHFKTSDMAVQGRDAIESRTPLWAMPTS